MEENCREILTALRTYLDGECPDDLEEVVARHIVDCPPCLDRADFERELQAMVAHKCKEQAPPDLLDRVLRRIDS